MEIMSDPTVLDDVSYSVRVREVPGAQRDEAMGEKVHMEAMSNISVHFLRHGQFLNVVNIFEEIKAVEVEVSAHWGFSGSSGVSQPTRSLSRSINTRALSPLDCAVGSFVFCGMLSASRPCVPYNSFSISFSPFISTSSGRLFSELHCTADLMFTML